MSSPKLVGSLGKITEAACPARNQHLHTCFLSPPAFRGNVSLYIPRTLFLPNLGLDATAFSPGSTSSLLQPAVGSPVLRLLSSQEMVHFYQNPK